MEEQSQTANTNPASVAEKSSPDSEDKGLLPLPDIGDLYFALILNLVLFTRPTYLYSDGSTGWHLAAGEYILKTMSVPRQDLMSYTFPDKQWVAYEWLYDAFLALLVQLGGLNLAAVATAIIIGYIFMRLYDTCRANACPLAWSCVFTLLGVLASAMHWLVRPHIVTMFGVFLYSSLLEDFYENRISKRKLILCLALFMVLWVNCHPAFLLGIAMTGLYMVICAVQSVARKEAPLRQAAKTKAIALAIAVVVVLLATLLNPYGFQLYEYIAHYLKGSAVLAETDEFLSPNFKANIHAICLEFLFLFLTVGLAISKNRLSVPQLCMSIVFAHLSLSAQRNIPLFSIIVLPVLGKLFGKAPTAQEELATNIDSTEDEEKKLGVIERYKAAWIKFEEQEARCKMHIVAICFAVGMIALALAGGTFAGKTYLKCEFDPANKPTKTLDYLKEHNLLTVNGCNLDNWGGYIRHKLGIRVFIDDRADFYGEPFYFQYKLITNMFPGWKNVVDKYKVGWILFPSNSKTAGVLKEEPDWKLVSEDPASKLYVRANIAGTLDSSTPPAPSPSPSSNTPEPVVH